MQTQQWSQLKLNVIWLHSCKNFKTEVLMHMLRQTQLSKDLWMQVLRVWQQEATKQRDDRAILDRFVRHMLRYTQAKVFRTWSAAARYKIEARAKAHKCHTRLASLRLKHALLEWRSQAIYKQKTKRMLKVCNTN